MDEQTVHFTSNQTVNEHVHFQYILYFRQDFNVPAIDDLFGSKPTAWEDFVEKHIVSQCTIFMWKKSCFTLARIILFLRTIYVPSPLRI